MVTHLGIFVKLCNSSMGSIQSRQQKTKSHNQHAYCILQMAKHPVLRLFPSNDEMPSFPGYQHPDQRNSTVMSVRY